MTRECTLEKIADTLGISVQDLLYPYRIANQHPIPSPDKKKKSKERLVEIRIQFIYK